MEPIGSLPSLSAILSGLMKSNAKPAKVSTGSPQFTQNADPPAMDKALDPATKETIKGPRDFELLRKHCAAEPRSLWPSSRQTKLLVESQEGKFKLCLPYQQPDFSPQSILNWGASSSTPGLMSLHEPDIKRQISAKWTRDKCFSSWFDKYGMRNCSNMYAYGIEEYIVLGTTSIHDS